MANESAMWQQLQKEMGERWKAFRVENAALPGTPDVSYCIDGRWGWLELKYRARNPTKLTRKTLNISAHQALFNRCYGSWVLAHAGSLWMLFDDVQGDELRPVGVWDRLHQNVIAGYLS